MILPSAGPLLGILLAAKRKLYSCGNQKFIHYQKFPLLGIMIGIIEEFLINTSI